MTEGRLEIPEAAIEAQAKARHGRVLCEHWADVGGERRMQLLDEARLDLEAVYPHLLAAFTERLLGDEAVDAGDNALMAWSEVEPDRMVPDFKTGLEAALASIDAGKGADRGV